MDSRASDVLKKQRYLAAQTLQKANEMFDRSPLRNSSSSSSSRKYSAHTPPTQDQLRYDDESMLSVQPRQYRSINITELEEEHTIHMQATPQKVSFEPTEMTARSTGEMDALRRRLTVDALAPDIQQLLHASISDEVREFAGGKPSIDSAVHLLQHDDRPDLSLPRTADMSRLSSMRDSLSSNPRQPKTQDFWDVSAAPAFGESWMKKELSQLEDISFRPADEQQSRLMEDEMAWEQEQAIIPEMNAAKGHPAPKGASQKLPKNLKNHVDFSCFSGFLGQEATRIEDSSYCSVGEYFNKMSDDLKGMIPDDASPPRRTPLPLVDMSNLGTPNETTTARGGASPGKRQHGGQKVTSDKENSTLNMSSIMNVINSMGSDESPSAFYEKIRQLRAAKAPPATTDPAPARSARSSVPAPEKRPSAKPIQKTTSLKTDLSLVTKTPSFMRDLSEAQSKLSDTASFTESLLESSAFVPIRVAGRIATSSPMTAPPSAAKSLQSEAEGTYRISTAKKPLLETYRVSTATKMSEHQLDLPPIPMIPRGDPPKCQKQMTFLDVPDAKPNRKRRSSSATRQELLEAQEKHAEVVNEVAAAAQKRSRSPANGAELRVVAGGPTVGYHETPKSSMAFGGRPQAAAQQVNKSYLSPEPRSREFKVRSPYSSPKGEQDRNEQRYTFGSPKSVASSVDSGIPEFPKSPVSDAGRSNLLASAGRSASQCSVAGSEYSHKDGVLPLKATHTEISWGSTKLRQNARKIMQIKNTSGKRLVIRACISGPGFQLGGIEQSEMLTLQSQECRTIVVNFCPTVIGPAIGCVCFQPPHDCHSQRVVTLYGYGGEASIKVEGIQKGPSGPFLELGQARNLGRPLEKSFSLYNKGSLAAFARIGIDKKGLDQAFLATAVFVQPQKVIIPANSYAHIRVTFKPRRQDVEKILQKQVDVLSITNLHIMWGDEPTRHRTRKIITTIKQNELQDRNKITPYGSVCDTFPGERELDELDNFAEHMFETMHELFLTFREYELVLTVDRALDDSMVHDLSLSEDSSALFKTMYATSSEAGSPRLPDEISPGIPATWSAKRDSGESWSVRPTRLDYRTNERTKQFVIKSNFYTTQFFELNSNYRPFFKFSPMEGQIRPGQEVVVNVSFQMGPPQAQQQHEQPIVIVVYIENEKITIPVNIITRSRPGVGPY
ncbi:hypothetical protein quinque_002767 [Culex quinquefasciatus]